MSEAGLQLLEQLVAHRAGLSRRLAATAVRRGRVTVEGAVVRKPRLRVSSQADIRLDRAPLTEPPRLVVWHKPRGVHCTLRDGLGRPTLWDDLAELLNRHLRPVGRLDADTSGLLLLTRDGALTQRLLHPKRAVARTYVARVEGHPGPGLVAALADGVRTAEGVFTAEQVTVDQDVVQLTVREGKHRMVRRMLANAGHPVIDLRRVSFGAFELGDLPLRSWREPTDAEIAWSRGLSPPGAEPPRSE